jgi:hypothetical protein
LFSGRREFEYTILWLEKIAGRTHHNRSGSQLLTCGMIAPQKQRFLVVRLHSFQQLRTIDPPHRKLKASTIRMTSRFCISLPRQALATALLGLASAIRAYAELS